MTTYRTVSPVTRPPGRRIGSTRPAIQPLSRSGPPEALTRGRKRATSPNRHERRTDMGSEMREMHQESMAPRMSQSNSRGGHLYMQTNEIRNAIVHYDWSSSGALTEVERVPTGGAGSGTFKPISGQDSAPNAFEGAGSVILSPDRRLLFTTNGGDNSVSSFRVGKDGRLTPIDVKPTGNPVKG